MSQDNYSINRGAYRRTLSNPSEIAASATINLHPSQVDRERYAPFNRLIAENQSNSDIGLIIDAEAQDTVLIQAGQTKIFQDIKFSTVAVNNKNSTYAINAGEITLRFEA